MEAPQKLKNRTTLQPSNSICGYLPKENKKPTYLKIYVHLSINPSITDNSQGMKGTQLPINRLVDEKEVSQLCNGILLGHEKEENPASCANMHEGIMLREIS